MTLTPWPLTPGAAATHHFIVSVNFTPEQAPERLRGRILSLRSRTLRVKADKAGESGVTENAGGSPTQPAREFRSDFRTRLVAPADDGAPEDTAWVDQQQRGGTIDREQGAEVAAVDDRELPALLPALARYAVDVARHRQGDDTNLRVLLRQVLDQLHQVEQVPRVGVVKDQQGRM